MRFGATGDGTTFYFMVLNRLWRSLTVGSEHDISLVFDDYAPWSGAATAVDFGDGVKGLWIDVDSDFLTEFAKAEALYLSYEGDIIGSFDLEDSAKAMVVMLECEQNLDAILADVGLDPFAGGTRTDPFAGRVGERR
ncbi:hypothetical protein GC169_10235 [bacterium]|nr:hypothetical protein [bacterium]